jgi:hypothetical protein
MAYTKDVQEIENITGCTTTKIKRGNIILFDILPRLKHVGGCQIEILMIGLININPSKYTK